MFGNSIIGSKVRILQGDEELTAPSLCVIAAGVQTPDLSDQTLQDYQVLRVKTEAEALAGSRAEAFLWLTSTGKLAPQALEECLWALQSADWVTWQDTGAAPAPTMRDVAGPLGLSCRALEWPEPKPGGTVRRLPWRCIGGPAERHAEESIPANGLPQSQAPKRGSHWLGRTIAHLQNAGFFSLQRWREDPIGTPLMLVPAAWKQRMNRRAGRAVFDLSGYARFDADASYANGLLLKPLRYAVVEKRNRKRVAVVVAHLGESEAARALLGVVSQIDRQECEVIVIAESSSEKRWKQRWADSADYLFEVGLITGPEERERMMLSLALNWKIDALLLAEASAAYTALPAIKQRLPGLRTADVVADVDAGELTDSTVDSLDFRLARSQAAANRLEGMAIGNQQVSWIPYGVELSASYQAKGAEIAIGFRGQLERPDGADLLPALAEEVRRLLPDVRISWVIAGTGALESRLRQAFAGQDATFVGDQEPAADLLIVLSERSHGDWNALQALRRATPVVAFHTDSREEVVAPECGVLVPGGRDGELRIAAAVAGLLQDAQAFEQMRAAGRRYVAEKYTTAAEIAQSRDFVERFLAPAPGKIQSGGS
jgi:hypothetical protein